MLSRIAKVPGLSLSRNPAVLSIRGVATGDNSQPYSPTPAKYTRDDLWETHMLPPYVPEFQDVTVKSLDEAKNMIEPIEDSFRTWFGSNMATINEDKDPARDLVNFPRPQQVVYPEGRRLIIFPDSWFRFLYPKTGVTGPYTLLAGLTTFLLSKEYLIIEEEMYIGAHLCILFTIAWYKFGPSVNESLIEQGNSTGWIWNEWQKDSIAKINEYIAKCRQVQESLKGQSVLFEAKRENIGLQREAEYRRRLQVVYQEVKRKLDYQVATDNSRRQFEQKHMVNWILKQVNDAVTKQDEKQVLSKCVSDLKALAIARKGLI